MSQPPGLDLGRLAAWLPGAVSGSGAELSARMISGGRSNLTYELTDGNCVWILRRPPLGHVLPTAHDMGREHRVMSALHETAVPVPEMVALCPDPEVLGAPFYLMSKVAGRPYRRASELEYLGQHRTRVISNRLIETLACLHQVDPSAVGLGDFGNARGFLGRQVARWKGQLDASYCRDLRAADELHARLSARVPPETSAAIVHGDFRLDNILMDASDNVAAVIDWEMATLGDPLTDLALMLVYARLTDLVSGLDAGEAISDVTLAPGFLSESEIISSYEAGTGRDLSNLGFHIALAAFKLAGILEGIHYRHLHGQTVGPGFDRLGSAVQPLLETGLNAIKEHA